MMIMADCSSFQKTIEDAMVGIRQRLILPTPPVFAERARSSISSFTFNTTSLPVWARSREPLSREVLIEKLTTSTQDIIRSAAQHLNLQTITAIALIIVASWYTLRAVRRRSRAQRYAKFAHAQQCGDLKVIPTSSFSAIWHKLRLISASETLILDEIWPEKFARHSDTHALTDGHGVPKVVHTTNPANAHAIMVTNFADWGPTPRRSETLYPLAPEALGTTDGPAWVHNRKMVMKHVGTFRVKDTRSNEAAIQLLFDAIGGDDVAAADSPAAGWTREVDLMDLFLRMALDMTTEYLLGTSFGSQENGIRDRSGGGTAAAGTGHQRRKKYGLTWEQAFEIAREYMSWRAKLGSKAWMADSPRYRQACNALNAFIDELILRAIDGTAKSDVDDAVAAARFGLVGNLVRERGADPVKIRDFVIDILIAGQNMTGVMASWIFARLQVHEGWYPRVREEVLRSFGTESEPRLPLTWDHLRACKDLQNVIQECLRLYPLLPAIGRSAKQDTVLPTGGGPDGTQPIAVPKGAAATINLYIMHRRRDIWGEDAWEFNPDRWTGRKVGKGFAPL